jgi:8-oxo-dGTP pyrophosphatase MutT (NUDIX family)
MDEKGRVLMGLRCKKTDLRQWSFPGGTVELGESPFMAAIRETREEVALEPMNMHYIGCFEMNGVQDFVFAVHLQACHGKADPNPREFSRLRWFEPGDIGTMRDIFPYSKTAFDMLLNWTT